MNKKISFFLGSLGEGGSEVMSVNIANGLISQGWNVDFVCINLNKKFQMNKLSKKINVVNLDIKRFAYSFIPVMNYIKKNKVKNVVCFNYLFALQFILQRFFFKEKFKIIVRNNTILTNHLNFNLKNVFFKNLIFWIVKLLYSRVDHLISQNEEMKIDLIKNFSFMKDKINIFLNPIDQIIEDSYDQKKIFKENYILLVGRLSQEKRYDIAIKVFRNVRQKFSNLKLKIAGIGKDESFLKELAYKYGINENIEFLGYQKDLVTLYKKARLTLITSSYEGFPNVMIESLFLGTPVVSFDFKSGPREVIRDGINGFLVNNNDESSLEQKIVESLNNDWDIEIIHNTVIKHNSKNIITEYDKFFSKIYSN